jgi:GntR family histidine utilization transcriptional repressor
MSSDARGPGWQAIRDEALRRIRTRQWLPGALIPHEADLAQELGCARATVNRALRDLAETGLIERRRKGGTRVVMTPLRRATLHIPVIRQEVEARGGAYGYRLLARAVLPAPDPIAAQLGLEPGTPLLHLRALHLCDDRPHVYEDRWISPETVPEALAVEWSRANANEWLVQNVPYTRGTLSLSAVGADRAMAEALQCAPGSALFTMQRITWKGAEPVTFVTQSFAPGYSLTTAI